MRLSGVAEDARGFGLQDHLCWRYGDAAEFRVRAGEFLAEGLALGQRVCYVGVGEPGSLADELCEVEGMSEALRRGDAQVTSVSAAYPHGAVIDPADQVRAYAALTEDALEANFTGLRVAADATSLVRTPEQLSAFVRYESLIDRYMSAHPFSAMCAYDRRELGEHAVAQLASMHPNSSPEAAPFRLHASERTDCAATLGGELDLVSAELFPLALDRANLQVRDGELVLDAADLTFVDHRSLLWLAEHARRRAASVVLRTSHPGASRIIEALNLTDVRVEPLT